VRTVCLRRAFNCTYKNPCNQLCNIKVLLFNTESSVIAFLSFKKAKLVGPYQRQMLADGLCVGEIFHADGFIVLHDVFSAEHISSLHLQAVQSFAEVSSIIKERNFQFGVGVKQGFKEIVQRHPNRYEMPYRMSEDVYNFVLGNPLIRETVSKILQCDDYIVANRSLVISMPGCDDQAWHSDGPHMSATQDLPCHCLNVFIPLVDVNSENGPTEIRPGSHFYTRDLAKSMFLAKIKKTLRPIEGPHLTKGSVLMVCAS